MTAAPLPTTLAQEEVGDAVAATNSNSNNMIASKASAATRRRATTTAAGVEDSSSLPSRLPQQRNKPTANHKGTHAMLQQQQYKILVVVIVVAVWFTCAYLWTYQELASIHPSHQDEQGMLLPLIRGVPQPTTATSRRRQQQQRRRNSAKTSNSDTISSSNNNNNKTLVLLYPPGLIGGYRNQVIRFLSLVQYALDHNMGFLLQNSLMWATQVSFAKDHHHHGGAMEEVWYPIPMDLLFDIEHWNTFAPQLPQIVPLTATAILAGATNACWQWNTTQPASSSFAASPGVARLTQHVVQQGMLPSVANVSYDILWRTPFGKQINMRRWDLLPQAQEGLPSSCHDTLDIYGGGKGAGRLWNDYIEREQSKRLGTTPALVLQALQPKREWREWASSRCIQAHMPTATTTTTTTTSPKYVALHARMELEMMEHNCGKDMLRNLTQLLDMVEAFVPDDVGGVLVAVSRKGMEQEGNEALYRKFQVNAEENVAALNRAVGSGLYSQPGMGLKAGAVPVFECGQHIVDEYYQEHFADSIDYGSLLPSMLNFHVATEASIFIGVRHSSYSTDIWTTRYHQGKGLSNYEYTPQGIIPMENNGLPPPHKNCERKRSPPQGQQK